MSGTADTRAGRGAAPIRRRALVLLALCATLAAGCQPLWSQRGYGPGHGAYNPGESLLTTDTVGALDVAYEVDLPFVPSAEPIVVDGSVFVAGIDHSGTAPVATVSASGSKTGAATWTTTLTAQTIEVSDAVVEGPHVVVLTHDDDGAVVAHALLRSTGAVAWTTTVVPAASPEGWTTVSPVLTVVGQRLVVSALVSDGPPGEPVHEQLAAGIDTSSGAVVWTRRAGVRDPRGSRVAGIGDGNVVWSYADAAAEGIGDAYVTRALDAADGTEHWVRDAFVGDIAVAAAAADGNRIVGDLGPDAFPDGSGGVLDGATGSVVWHGAPSGVAPLVVTDSRAVWPVLDGEGLISGLRSYALANGGVQWSWDLPAGSQVRTAAVAGPVLYAVTDDGTNLTLRTYDVASGASIGSVGLPGQGGSETPVAGPVVLGGRVVLTVADRLVSLTG